MALKVSVLLPVYNGAASVQEAIESVLSQDYDHFEFVIVDNASTDGTAEIIAKYSGDPRLRVIRNDQTIGRLANFVKVFTSAAAESRWLKFIGDDDRLLPGCLREMVRVAEDGDQIGLVSSYYYDGERLVHGAVAAGMEQLSGPQYLRRLLLEPESRCTVFSPASLLVSHDAYRQLGPFRTDLLHADHELFYRILNRYNLGFVHQPLTVSGYHSGSGQAGSTASGDTFMEAYRIRYRNLPLYDQVKVSCWEREKIKLNLVVDSAGFMLGALARGQWRKAGRHLWGMPAGTLYHLPLALFYFIKLAIGKLLRREPFQIWQ